LVPACLSIVLRPAGSGIDDMMALCCAKSSCNQRVEPVSCTCEPSLSDQDTDIENSRPETRLRNRREVAPKSKKRRKRLPTCPINSRKCRANFCKPDMAHRDGSGWLRTQSDANRSLPSNSLLTGKLTGNFSDFGLPSLFLSPNQCANPMACGKIPWATEQGIF
jgi:hypothetical protein